MEIPESPVLEKLVLCNIHQVKRTLKAAAGLENPIISLEITSGINIKPAC